VFCGSIAGCVVLNAKSPSKNCNTLQYIATMYVYIYIIGLLFCQCPLCCAAQSRGLRCWMRNYPQHIATHCNTLQHTATHCNTLQHTATHCNTLQHTATIYSYIFWICVLVFSGPLCFAARSRGLWCWMRNHP